MKCLFLKGQYMISCTVMQEVYIPSMYELEEFCRHTTHMRCPLYRIAEAEGRVIVTPSIQNHANTSP